MVASSSPRSSARKAGAHVHSLQTAGRHFQALVPHSDSNRLLPADGAAEGDRAQLGEMNISDGIIDLLRRKRSLRLTSLAIAEILYWNDKTYRQRVAASCLALYDQGYLARGGKGTPADPYTYSMRRDGPAFAD